MVSEKICSWSFFHPHACLYPMVMVKGVLMGVVLLVE